LSPEFNGGGVVCSEEDVYSSGSGEFKALVEPVSRNKYLIAHAKLSIASERNNADG